MGAIADFKTRMALAGAMSEVENAWASQSPQALLSAFTKASDTARSIDAQLATKVTFSATYGDAHAITLLAARGVAQASDGFLSVYGSGDMPIEWSDSVPEQCVQVMRASVAMILTSAT